MSESKPSLRQYRRELRAALANPFLRGALESFASAYPEGRARALAGLDFQRLVEEVAQAKDESCLRLQELHEQFAARAAAAGARVHRAADGAEANAIIAEIARTAGAKKIVKSKSMTAEEIFLNHYLEGQGFEVTETDLGEWIIQLRREGPSHMVLPAIHLSRQQVAELFSQVSGRTLDPDDIEGLVAVARHHLRQAFLQADMGISGANFAVAATGTLGIVTNEGNGRMVTTMPRIHVALVGYDKLVPDLAAAMKLLRLLPRNATGQPISTYVSWITGAGPHGSEGGRKELHVVFLDNGRLRLAADPVFGEALRCIRCGACANVCPIYRLVGGHNYGYVYIGAIGLVLTAFFHGESRARVLVRNCLNCQACREICAAGIDLPRLVKEVDRRLAAKSGRPWRSRVLSRLLSDRRAFHAALRTASRVQAPLQEGEYLRHLPLLATSEHRFRRLPAIARVPLRDRWPQIRPRPRSPRLRAAVFGGCLVDFVYPEQGEALCRLCDAEGIGLEYPLGQSCCGLPAQMAGELECARQVARQNVEAFAGGGFDYVVTLCASCGSHLKHNLPRLLQGDPRLAGAGRTFAAKVMDLATFVSTTFAKVPKDPSRQGSRVAYHAPCHLSRGLGVRRPPRQLLRAAGLAYVPARDEEVCCGFGGTYSLDFPEISAELLRQKLDHLEATGAELVATDCPGCVLQLRGGLQARRSRLRAVHLVEVLAPAAE